MEKSLFPLPNHVVTNSKLHFSPENRNPVSATGNLNNFPPIGRYPLRTLPYIEIMNNGDITTGINPTSAEFELWSSVDQRVQQLTYSPCNKQKEFWVLNFDNHCNQCEEISNELNLTYLCKPIKIHVSLRYHLLLKITTYTLNV